MSDSTLPVRLFALAARARTFLTPIALLFARLGFGQMFVLTGIGKLRDLPRVVEFFTGLGIPFPQVQAPMIATLEFVGGVALLLGLCTRSFAVLLASTMVVALLTADGASLLAALPFRDNVTAVTPVAPLIVLMLLITHGGGVLSVDGWWARRTRAEASGRYAAA